MPGKGRREEKFSLDPAGKHFRHWQFEIISKKGKFSFYIAVSFWSAFRHEGFLPYAKLCCDSSDTSYRALCHSGKVLPVDANQSTGKQHKFFRLPITQYVRCLLSLILSWCNGFTINAVWSLFLCYFLGILSYHTFPVLQISCHCHHIWIVKNWFSKNEIQFSYASIKFLVHNL
jgi:hypothetical protein